MVSAITAKQLGDDRRKPRAGRRADDHLIEPVQAGPSLSFLAQVVNQMRPDTTPIARVYPAAHAAACGSIANERA
jgi:hypothetical protein